MAVYTKVLIFFVISVACNQIFVEGSLLRCDPTKDQQNITWTDVLGFWNVIYIPVYLPEFFNHVTINITINENTMYMNETANILKGEFLTQHIDKSITIGGDILECCKGGPDSDGKSQIHLQRSLSIPKDGSTVTENIGFPLNLLGSEILFISKDTKCYILFQHCVKAINIAEKAIAFRDKVPTKECEDAALAAYKESGLDPASISKDRSFE